VNLECRQTACADHVTTSLTGTVNDPAGRVPLYNVIVYVPNSHVEPFTQGTTCDRCGTVASGNPLVTGLTDSHGVFELQNVPSGDDIPLVIQVGKWRRQITIPHVDACKKNEITSTELTRLPRKASEGDLPQIAITTGGCDALECLLRKVGIDDSEFTPGSGNGHVHLYQGDGGSTIPGATRAEDLWTHLDTLTSYDMVLFSCECSENRKNKPLAAYDALHAYSAQGGRIFGTHYHYVWFMSGQADFQSTAHYDPNGSEGGLSPFFIDTTFPKGQAFADWLVYVGASTQKGEIALHEVAGDVSSVNAKTSQQWIYSSDPQSTKFLSFNTPVGKEPDAQCGRVVYSDLHVASGDDSGGTFPSGCYGGGLTAQEKALEFLFFDLSACVQGPLDPPPSPPVR